MDKLDLVFLIVVLYLISLIITTFFSVVAVETEFCKQNGFEEYLYKGNQEFCRNKVFEENELVFEKKPIYCERDFVRPLYYQPYTKACYFLKEVIA